MPWSTVGASLWHLAQDPADHRRLVAEPGLMATAVEEFLRACAPVTMARLVAKDFDFHGHPMKEGDWLLLPSPLRTGTGFNVIVDKDFGITHEFVVAPVARNAITIANALGVLTIALVQVALIVALAIARGAEFHTSASDLVWFMAAAALLTLTIYGVAEILALRIGRQEAYGPLIPAVGPLIPAVGVTPWFLSGALFPITVLPAGIEQLSLLSPWTHPVASGWR